MCLKRLSTHKSIRQIHQYFPRPIILLHSNYNSRIALGHYIICNWTQDLKMVPGSSLILLPMSSLEKT